MATANSKHMDSLSLFIYMLDHIHIKFKKGNEGPQGIYRNL